MAQITLTLDLTPETLEILKLLTDASSKTAKELSAVAPTNEKPEGYDDEPEKEKKASKRAASKDKKAVPVSDEADAAETEVKEAAKSEAPKISMTEVRAAALKLSKAGKQKELKDIFAKYGAGKLSDVSEDDYASLMNDLEAENG